MKSLQELSARAVAKNYLTAKLHFAEVPPGLRDSVASAILEVRQTTLFLLAPANARPFRN